MSAARSAPAAAPRQNTGQTKPRGKKRTLTLATGENVDLLKIPVTAVHADIVEAMRARIIELEDQLAAKGEPPKKKARVAAPAGSFFEAKQPAVPSTSAATTKASDKKRQAQLKKIFDRVKKECKSVECKFQGTPKTIKFDEVLEYEEFQGLFSGKGTLIQPTPQNKPTSTVTIIDFNRYQVADFFGDELKALTGFRWSRGGIPQRNFGFMGIGGGLSKSQNEGSCDVELRSLQINYSKNGMKCNMKFEVAETYGYMNEDDDKY
ncbi:hypothetical protein BKA62DRAFT_703305 [Auriculariales sp. MPI-PUGE-AT-0066]|nr:hypothetical protein BKA62DRAFT_703305 [Auriculariales sp. MPI-PUGE-AT-0066]